MSACGTIKAFDANQTNTEYSYSLERILIDLDPDLACNPAEVKKYTVLTRVLSHYFKAFIERLHTDYCAGARLSETQKVIRLLFPAILQTILLDSKVHELTQKLSQRDLTEQNQSRTIESLNKRTIELISIANSKIEKVSIWVAQCLKINYDTSSSLFTATIRSNAFSFMRAKGELSENLGRLGRTFKAILEKNTSAPDV